MGREMPGAMRTAKVAAETLAPASMGPWVGRESWDTWDITDLPISH